MQQAETYGLQPGFPGTWPFPQAAWGRGLRALGPGPPGPWGPGPQKLGLGPAQNAVSSFNRVYVGLVVYNFLLGGVGVSHFAIVALTVRGFSSIWTAQSRFII